MKRGYSLISVLVLCTLLFAGCVANTGSLAMQNSTSDATRDTQTGKNDALRTIDPLGIAENLETNVLDATTGTEFVVDYQIIPQPESYKYKYMHEAFEFMGENEYAYYSFYTPLDASLIHSAEYEVYFNGTKPDVFVQKFNDMYDALCREYGSDSIYQMGNMALDAPAGNIKSLPLESIIDCFKAYKNGAYYISWQGADYLAHMQIILDNQKKDGFTGKSFYEVKLAFDKSAQVQEMVKASPGAYEVDRNAILSSIDPMAFTWLDALGTDIGNFTEGKTEGKDYDKLDRPEADEDYSSAHADYIFHPYGISFMGRKDPIIIMVVPEGSGIYSISYAAAFNKDNDQDLESHIANFLAEYNNLCTLYGQPTEISVTGKGGAQGNIDVNMMMIALANNMVGMYTCYWENTPDGYVFLDILNPSEDEEINGRLSFTE